MYVCICVSIYVCMYVYMYVRMYSSIPANESVSNACVYIVADFGQPSKAAKKSFPHFVTFFLLLVHLYKNWAGSLTNDEGCIIDEKFCTNGFLQNSFIPGNYARHRYTIKWNIYL
jgi:hypothetical protein